MNAEDKVELYYNGRDYELRINDIVVEQYQEKERAKAAFKAASNLYCGHTPKAKAKANDKQVAGTHYKDMGVQVWDVVDSWPQSERIGYYRGNALKYVMRMGKKDASAQEIKKAIHYLEKLVEILEETNEG